MLIVVSQATKTDVFTHSTRTIWSHARTTLGGWCQVVVTVQPGWQRCLDGRGVLGVVGKQEDWEWRESHYTHYSHYGIRYMALLRTPPTLPLLPQPPLQFLSYITCKIIVTGSSGPAPRPMSP